MRAIQIATGLGGGGLGSEVVYRAFWNAVPPSMALDVELLAGEHARALPSGDRFRQLTIDGADAPPASVGAQCGVLVGDVPLGGFLAARLEALRAAGLPIDAVGAGFEDPPEDPNDELLRSIRGVRSWSVRSPQDRVRLSAMGVSPERIVVGSDWSWLFTPLPDPVESLSETWTARGVDPHAPLVVVGVHGPWSREERSRSLAEALDRLVAQGFQVVFLPSEPVNRANFEGEAAATVMARMKQRAVALPAGCSPDRIHALLARAAAAVSSRYHVIVQSVLAGTLPVALPVGTAMRSLLEDIALPPAAGEDAVDPGTIVAAVAPPDRARTLALLQDARRRMVARAANNLALWPQVTGSLDEARRRAGIVERMSSMIWYHRIELAPGVITPGQHWDPLWAPMQKRHREVDFRGKTVLDIGCWDGYWSFESERLGAGEVWATDDMSQRRSVTRTVPFAIECLRSKVRYRDDVSVYDVDERMGRRFDVVIFYGVLYHLRYPVLALAKVRRVLNPGGLLLLETAVLLDTDEPLMRWGHRAVYPDDPSSWNAVSLPCLRALLESSYFEIELCETTLRHDDRLGRGFVRARAVGPRDPDLNAVPDHFLKDIAAGADSKQSADVSTLVAHDDL